MWACWVCLILLEGKDGHWVTQTLWRNELVREGEETAVMAVTKGGPAPSPSSQPLGILSFLPKVQCTPLLLILGTTNCLDSGTLEK